MKWNCEYRVGAERRKVEVEAGSRDDARLALENHIAAAAEETGLRVTLASLEPDTALAKDDGTDLMTAAAKQRRDDADRGLTTFPHPGNCDCRLCHLPDDERALRDLQAAEKCIRSARAAVAIRQEELTRVTTEQKARLDEARRELERRQKQLERARAAVAALKQPAVA